MTNMFDIDTSIESPELLAFAEKVLNETPEAREKGFKELRELLKQNPDLSFTDDEEYLTIILRCCHWYPESAIKMVNISNLIREIFNEWVVKKRQRNSFRVFRCDTKIEFDLWAVVGGDKRSEQ